MRRSSWWVGAFGAMASGAVVSALASASCSTDDCSINGCPSTATCTLDSKTNTASCVANPISSSSSSSSSQQQVDAGDGGFGFGNPPTPTPGDGGPCSAAVGSAPSSTCDPSDEMTCSTTSGCNISSECTAGDPTCEAFAKNSGNVFNFRMRYIGIAAPPQLATSFVQGTVVTNAVDLPAPDGGTCGESGQGLFNWLISVDQGQGLVKTGGAPQSADPYGQGYCYFNAVAGTASVGPIFMNATFTGNSFSTTAIEKTLYIPIFQTAGDYSNPVILPIDGASFNNVTVSNEGNCIGTVNNDSLSPSPGCTAGTPSGPESCSRWHTAGSLTGYITLKNADTVPITLISGESLCVLLTGDTNGATPPKCTSAGLAAGNYCSTTKSGAPGNCGDSFWLAALFSASAVNINEGVGPLATVCAPVDGGAFGSGTGSGTGSSSGTGSGTGSGT